jgi:acetyl esterase/lipase
MPSPYKPPYDPECEPALNAFPKLPPLTDEVVVQIRKALDAQATPEVTLTDPAISHVEKTIPGPGGSISLSILRSRTSAGGARPGIVYMHAGGMILGSKLFGIQGTFEWIKQLDAIVISVEYRLAPEHPDPAPIEDCYAALKWVSEHVSELGIDPSKLLVAGNSAGAGLAAGLALLARDRRGPKIFAQCLIYPMLDDRMTTVSSLQFADEGTWSGKNNLYAWNALLAGRRGATDVSIYAAPARAKDLSGLPPAWVDVGGNELFRDENVIYASRLAEFGIPVELHVWPGGWHAFDTNAPNTALSNACLQARMTWFKRILTATPSPPKKISAML